MDPELSRTKLEEAYAGLLERKGLIAEHGWSISRDNFDVYVEVHPKTDPGQIFIVRLRCDDYPQKAPSLQVVNAITKEIGAQYWPDRGSPFTSAIIRNPIALCIEGNREFYETLHRDYQWDHVKFSFAKILQDVQVELDKAYQ